MSGPRRSTGGAVVVAALLVAARAAPLGAQALAGRVVDESTGAPVPEASVGLLDPAGRAVAEAVSDSLGHFVLAIPGPGDYHVVAARLGYEDLRSPLLAISGEGTRPVDVVMTPLPIGLPGLEVEVEGTSEELLRSVGQSAAALGDRWIDRGRIEEVRSALGAGDLIRWQGIPGVSVAVSSASPLLSPLCVRQGRGGCSIVILNGILVDPVEANQIRPQELEAIAILSPTDATTLYGTRGGSGAVVLWTRRGGR